MTRFILIVTLLFASAFSNAVVCIKSDLYWPKLVITMNEESSYPEALEMLTIAAERSETGETEFYKAALEFRLKKYEASKLTMAQSSSKRFYLSAAFLGLAHEHGLPGYHKRKEIAAKYNGDYFKYAERCNEPTASEASLEVAQQLSMKLFGLTPATLRNQVNETP